MNNLLDRLRATLADRYALEREIGTGGMATVYLAHDLKHDRKVALKVLRPELASAIGAERFLNEIRVTANLHHPHILALFDSGQAEDFLYYVMPYVDGESLRQKLEREQQLPLDEAIGIAGSVASALGYAHGQGIVHRDIKPENILLHQGEVFVADFGIALALEAAGGARLTNTGFSPGTPHYMSPEQAGGSAKLDGRSDVYGLGCVLYEMLAGEPPFSGPNVQAVVARHMSGTPPSLRVVRPSVPEGVEQVVEKALAKLPVDRHATADEFADALKAGSTAADASDTAPQRNGAASGLVTNVDFEAVKEYDPRVRSVWHTARAVLGRAVSTRPARLSLIALIAVGLGSAAYVYTWVLGSPVPSMGQPAGGADSTFVVTPAVDSLVDPGVIPVVVVDSAVSDTGTRTTIEVVPRSTASQCETLNDSYNADGSCFDTQPRPLGATLVPLTEDIQGVPSPAVVGIKVNADGSVAMVQLVTPSGDAAFDSLVLEFARTVGFVPARKDGRPVVGWRRQAFYARRRAAALYSESTPRALLRLLDRRCQASVGTG